ncbi:MULTISPECIES: SIS domain-containing protein [unclassified Bradyrhizobium]|uniref:D-sedoheptulose-7-phosphate isomerase n=1 Tax=unclassified Bradyrhizobium TaxID=2631580 RepID=UPI002916304C|nr:MULTISPECIES: SIS domain-containing protein [unclassified Bradyrhizobium]
MLIQHLEASRAAMDRLISSDVASEVDRAIALITTALRGGHALLVCGNGGSAADAMHIAGELVGRFLRERRAINCICLASNPAVLTAWANDYSYDTVFTRQVEAFGCTGSVLLGISTSGNSANVVRAFEAARDMGIGTIAMTGAGGGRLAGLADVLLAMPSQKTPIIQQLHVCIYHHMCERIEESVATDMSDGSGGTPRKNGDRAERKPDLEASSRVPLASR